MLKAGAKDTRTKVKHTSVMLMQNLNSDFEKYCITQGYAQNTTSRKYTIYQNLLPTRKR
jgi:hypothetical protein